MKKSPTQKSSVIKSLRYNLQLYDGLWSIPVAFLLFAISGTLSYHYFGDALISTEYVQYVVLASMVIVFANFIIFLGIRFNFRSLQNMIYSREFKQQIKTDLTTWQKVCVYLLLYFGYFAAFLLVLRMLMMATA